MQSPEDDVHRERMAQLKQDQDAKVRARRERKGLIIVNTGDGKGKSTAAVGPTRLRAKRYGSARTLPPT
jgi:ATP:corrinoid adenosyltransferase